MSWFEHELLREASDEQRLARVCATTRSLHAQFMQACWARVRAGYQLPLFSMVPHYRPLGSDTASAPTHAFWLYPMRPLPDAAWEEMVRLILAQTPAERWRHIVVQSDAAAPIR
ncbi:hypothetical protein [Aeromonas hydrophila]|uniref:hypothetical protein n=1 Tax=Aeromonas hydrophila TaxID=644 RepID=UPI0038CF3814